MKKLTGYLLVALVLGAVALGAWGCGTAAAADGSPGSVYVVGQNTGISVTGTGKITVTPDLGILSAGVQVQAATVADAQQEAAKAMTALLAALRASGVDEKDIATSGYSVYPQYDYGQVAKVPTIIGYSVSNTVTVKIRKVADAGKIIDAAAAAAGDAVRVNSISFTVDKPEQYNEQARELAMADALKTAQQLAKLGEVTLGKPAFISESGGYTPQPPIYYGRDAAGAMPSVATPITPGQMEISLSVSVVYNIQ